MKNFKIYLATMLLMFSTAALAAPMTFSLGNHGDGGLYDGSTNPYGIRIDDTGQTFTVGDNLPGTYSGAALTLTFDAVNLAAGAALTGSVIDNATGTAWDLNYTLTGLTAAANGGFIAQAGSGTLTEQGGSGSLSLVGMSNGTGVFIFDNDGHRLDGDPGTGWVGRGWFDGSGSNDFLLTASPVPLPGAIWMLGAGLLGLLGAGRRK